jgi:DNA-binding HxlR family transcriptional regulator
MSASDHDNHPPSAFCPVFHRAIELIGRRWTGAILRVLMGGPTRFSEIATCVPGLSDRLLSERLKELEAEGIVARTVFPETPVRIEYALTEKGRDLEGVVTAVSSWAENWLAPPLPCDDNVAHDRCLEAAASEAPRLTGGGSE